MTSPSNATWRSAHCALAFLLVTTAAVAQPVVTWKRVIGSTRDDQGTGISFDGLGGVYISGQTTSSLGSVNAGSLDVFVAKYDTAGTQTWIRQFGSDAFDTSSGVSSDRLGNIFVVGDTQGALGGPHPVSSIPTSRNLVPMVISNGYGNLHPEPVNRYLLTASVMRMFPVEYVGCPTILTPLLKSTTRQVIGSGRSNPARRAATSAAVFQLLNKTAHIRLGSYHRKHHRLTVRTTF